MNAVVVRIYRFESGETFWFTGLDKKERPVFQHIFKEDARVISGEAEARALLKTKGFDEAMIDVESEWKR